MEHSGVALPTGSRLLGYEIVKELGAGTFGVTYLAIDTNLDRKVVIKEYFPNDIAIRDAHTKSIVPKSRGDNEHFEYGLDSFLKEAKVLARFNHPNIVKISRLFEENGTAYFVMDYDEGEDLQSYLSRYNTLSEKEILSIIIPILDGLRDVHDANFLHRDIKPGNIYIRENSSPMLIDFGASRMAMGVKSKSLSVVLTEGYAPKEQYSSTSKQDAYTDLYSIGAVMYKMATGVTPPEASARADAITDDEDDPLVRLQDREDLDYSSDFKKAVDWALSFRGKDRPQSVKGFQQALDSTQITKKSSSSKPILEKQKAKNNTLESSTSNKETSNHYLNVLKKYATFKGRATRSEYWYFVLFNTIIMFSLLAIDINFLRSPILFSIYFLGVFIPYLAVTVRRLHDIDESAWGLFILLIPYIGLIILFLYFLKDSKDDNKYGKNPKNNN